MALELPKRLEELTDVVKVYHCRGPHADCCIFTDAEGHILKPDHHDCSKFYLSQRKGCLDIPGSIGIPRDENHDIFFSIVGVKTVSPQSLYERMIGPFVSKSIEYQSHVSPFNGEYHRKRDEINLEINRLNDEMNRLKRGLGKLDQDYAEKVRGFNNPNLIDFMSSL